MRIKGLIFLLLLMLTNVSMAQMSLEKLALSRIEKKKWSKAEQTLKKAMRKDSINSEARYVYALWFYDTTNPDNNIDSSYSYVLNSIEDFKNSNERLRDRMSRFPLDSGLLVQTRERIEHTAFDRAKLQNTEESYNYFLNQFSLAKEKENATELRDEVSFLNALKINTYVSFLEYLNKYPASHRAEEASMRYEKLLFEAKTKDGKMKSYLSFYKDHPNSPYRAEVEERIFELVTASGDPSDYLQFTRDYPESKLKKRAIDIAYHIILTSPGEPIAPYMTDSLKRLSELNDGFWVPFLKNGKYGFANQNGEETLPPAYSNIQEEYLCGNVTEDFLNVGFGVLSRSGKLFFRGKVKRIEDLGFGILLVEDETCLRLVHKSGADLYEDCILDANIIAGRFIAIKNSKGWGLFAFNGKPLLPPDYEEISSIDDIVVFTKGGKILVNTIAEVAATADKNLLPETRVFDNIRKLNSKLFLVKNGALEGVVDNTLKFVIKLDRQVLSLTSFGFVKKANEKVTTIGISEALDKEQFNDIKPYADWLGLYRASDISLFHQPTGKVIDSELDSLWYSNRLAMSIKSDSVKIYFNSGRKVTFPISSQVSFIKSSDSVRYFYTEEKLKKDVFDVNTGNKLFTSDFNTIESLSDDILMISQKGKKGLLGKNGKSILPAEYDAIVKTSDDILSLLKNRKFGMFNRKSLKLIEANYERNLTFYSESVIVAFKDGYFGFIDEDAQPLSEFRFEEVRPWSDSTAMVKINFNWLVYDIYKREFSQDELKDYKLIKDSPSERIAIIYKENKYGVLSSTRGIIIPPTFTDIINLGTADNPLYFTEKHVEEADVFVVIYYSQHGKMIRREIYEAEEYDRIYCQ